MTAHPERRISAEEYLAIEEASENRNELVGGVIVAMSGNRYPHVVIVDNLILELNGRLRGKPCRVRSTDLKVKVELTDSYFYPDLVGICGKPIFEAPSEVTLLNPTILIEVLSPSTEAFDRGKKFLHYQQIPTLKEYVLISQVEARVEFYARGESQAWTYKMVSGLEAIARFDSIDCAVPLAEIYQEVEFKGDSIE
jgi:Uma2 family endonuclease